MASLPLTSQRVKLISNGRRAVTEPGFDPYPVIRLYAPDSAAQWLLSEIHPDDPNTAFGIIEIGDGAPDLGSITLAELAAWRSPQGKPLLRDRGFTATAPLSVYLHFALTHGKIVDPAVHGWSPPAKP
jgi:hypothetical protein